MKQFNLEHQYQLYLQRMALKESNMHPEQKRQLRQTFFGACGQLIILFRDALSDLPEDQGIVVLQSMLDQVGAFFKNESAKQN